MFWNRSSIFLLISLLKISSTINNDLQCSIRDICTNLTRYSPSIYDDEIYFQNRNCFCDSICEEYGDCCYSSSSSSSNRYECIDYLLPTIHDRTIPFYSLSVWMRTQCLDIYHGSSIEKQCRNYHNQSFYENPILFIPVTSTQTNITYRNYYCAHCNNDFDEYLQFWEYKAFCSDDGTDDNNNYLILNKDEDVQYYIYNLTRTCTKTIVYPHENQTSQPSIFIRPCKQSLPATCPSNTSIDLAQNCTYSHLAYRYISNSELIYRNQYCAECHHAINLEQITCFDPNLRSSIPPLILTRTHPLSILFDPNLLKSYLNNAENPQKVYSTKYQCSQSNELYDLSEQKCTKITNDTNQLIISLTCSIPIETNNYLNETISYENGSLYLIFDSIYLNKNEYVILNDNRILFCADQWLTKANLSLIQSSTFPSFRYILCIICTSISLLCLVLFILIYIFISSLHNLPGKCLLCLSISLFFGQLIFVSISNFTRIYWLCFLSGILIHFFYLSSFLWLLFISINVHSTFNQKLHSTNKTEKKTCWFIISNLLVWFTSGLIILIANLIQIYLPQSNYSPGYGSIVCSISKANALILFFLAPIGCILFLVSLLFLKTIWSIYHSRKTAKLARLTSSTNLKNKQLIFIYVRLASLMGMQWILLIAALIIQQTWLWIVFEIVNSLPGLFICLGFLCSKRVLNSLKQKFLKRKQTSGNNTTTSTILTSSLMASKSQKIQF